MTTTTGGPDHEPDPELTPRPGPGSGSGSGSGPAWTKTSLRRAALAARRSLSPADRASADQVITGLLLDGVRRLGAATVACYVPVGSEPGGQELPDRLRAHGLVVLLPVLRDDLDLDWAEFHGELVRSSSSRAPGLAEPAGALLGVEAVRRADLVVAPGLAVDDRGHRLGRGGGSYDRALARVPARVPVVVPLHRGEYLAGMLPAEAHDRPVTAAVTAADGWIDLPVGPPHRLGQS